MQKVCPSAAKADNVVEGAPAHPWGHDAQLLHPRRKMSRGQRSEMRSLVRAKNLSHLATSLCWQRNRNWERRTTAKTPKTPSLPEEILGGHGNPQLWLRR